MYLFPVSRIRVTGPKISAATFVNRTPTVTGCNSAFKFLRTVDRTAHGLQFLIHLSMSPHHGPPEPLSSIIESLV